MGIARFNRADRCGEPETRVPLPPAVRALFNSGQGRAEAWWGGQTWQLARLRMHRTMPPISTVPIPLSPGERERAMQRNVAAGFLGMGWMAVALGMLLPLLMQAAGASGWQLGLLAAAWQLAMVAQVPSAFLVERLRRRKPFWAAVPIAHRVLWVVPALLPWGLPGRRDLWPVVIIAALGVSNILGQGGTGPWQSWMADLVPRGRG